MQPSQSKSPALNSSDWPLPVWVEWLTLAILPFLIYAPSFSYNLLGVDDDLYYLRNSSLHGGHWPGPVDVWTHIFASEYFPVTASTLWVDLALFGSTSWAGARVHQLLWFVLGIFAVRALVFRVTGRRDFAWWAALLYAVHPVCCESVLWLAQRKNLVAQALAFWSIERYVAMHQAGSARGAWARGVASFVLCVGAVLSKAHGVCVPAVLAVYEIVLGRGNWGRRFAAWMPFAAVSAVFTFLFPLWIAEVLVGERLGGSRVAALAKTGWIVARYLWHTVAPLGFAFYYEVDGYATNSFIAWQGWSIVVCVLAAAIYLAADRRVAAFFWLGGFAALVPALNLVRQPIPMTDHYHHWAMWGWVTGCILMVHGIALRLSKTTISSAPWIAGLLALLLGMLSFARVPEFQNILTVTTNSVLNQPRSAWGQVTFMNALGASQDKQLRAQVGRQALSVFGCADAQMINPPDRVGAIREGALYLHRSGKTAEARALIEKESVWVEPIWLRQAMKAELALRMGDPAEALRLLEPDYQSRFGFLSKALGVFRDGTKLPYLETPVCRVQSPRTDEFSLTASKDFLDRFVRIVALAHLAEKNYEAALGPAALWSNLNPQSADARECLAQVYDGLKLPDVAARVRAR